MILQMDNDGYVTGFATMGGFPDGVEIDESVVPDGFEDDFWPRKYKIVEGKVLPSGLAKPTEAVQEPEPSPLEALAAENRLLKAQVQSLGARGDFLEDVITEIILTVM